MPRDNDPNWGAMMGIGLQMMAGVVLGVVVGQWLDRRNHWSPWGTVVCVAFGLASGMYSLIREGMRVNRDDDSFEHKRNDKEK